MNTKNNSKLIKIAIGISFAAIGLKIIELVFIKKTGLLNTLAISALGLAFLLVGAKLIGNLYKKFQNAAGLLKKEVFGLFSKKKDLEGQKKALIQMGSELEGTKEELTNLAKHSKILSNLKDLKFTSLEATVKKYHENHTDEIHGKFSMDKFKDMITQEINENFKTLKLKNTNQNQSTYNFIEEIVNGAMKSISESIKIDNLNKENFDQVTTKIVNEIAKRSNEIVLETNIDIDKNKKEMAKFIIEGEISDKTQNNTSKQ
jgi:hypothetical protein